MIGFAEEEGQRYAATFLGSGALVGDFKPEWLDQRDAQGTTMREAMQHAGLCIDDIPTLRRDPARYLGFVEVHIEQGPVLFEMGLPLGVVTSINGSVRYRGRIVGMASHAGTTPWTAGATRPPPRPSWPCIWNGARRRFGRHHGHAGRAQRLDQRGARRMPLQPDLRAPGNAQRDALATDVLAELAAICQRRGLRCELEETLRAAAAPSAPAWQARWERAVEALGLPVHRMPSGAGHDAMKLHEAMPQAMLFVRGQNFGISHNPLESTTANDMQLAAQALRHLLDALAHEMTR